MNGVVYRRSDRALWRRAGADVLVTTAEDEEVHWLTGGASAIWWGLGIEGSSDELVRDLAAAAGADPQGIRPEVEQCLIQLRDSEVLEEGP